MKIWRLWAKALGQKGSNDDRESDHIAHIRTVIFLTYLITNLFIVAGVIRHWNDEPNVYVQIEMSEPIPQNLLTRHYREGAFQ